MEWRVDLWTVAVVRSGDTEDEADIMAAADEADDAFRADLNVEYWVRCGNRYVPATAAQAAEIRAWEARRREENQRARPRNRSGARRWWARVIDRVHASSSRYPRGI